MTLVSNPDGLYPWPGIGPCRFSIRSTPPPLRNALNAKRSYDVATTDWNFESTNPISSSDSPYPWPGVSPRRPHIHRRRSGEAATRWWLCV